MVTKKKKGVSPGKVAAIGAGVAALGATAYYFLGPKGKKHQKDAKTWMFEAKEKIAQKVTKAKEMTKDMYDKVIDEVVDPYMKKGAGSLQEIKTFAENIKKQWKDVSSANATKGKVKSGAKKVIKKIAKKVTKTPVKKAVKKVAKKK